MLSTHPTVIDGELATSSRRPATVRVDDGPRRHPGPARRHDADRARRGRAGRQLVAERGREGHVGAVSARPASAASSPAGAEGVDAQAGGGRIITPRPPHDYSRSASQINGDLPTLQAEITQRCPRPSTRLSAPALPPARTPHPTRRRTRGSPSSAVSASSPSSTASRCAFSSRARTVRAWTTSRSAPARATGRSSLDAGARPARADVALHVHVTVPGKEAAVRALRGMRVHVPLCSPSRPTRVSGRVTTPASPARACRSSARFRASASRGRSTTTRLRQGDRHPAGPQHLPRANVPVVGTSAAAEFGTLDPRIIDAPDACGRPRRRARRARPVPRPARGNRGLRPDPKIACRPGVLKEEPLHRHAQRHAGRADGPGA